MLVSVCTCMKECVRVYEYAHVRVCTCVLKRVNVLVWVYMCACAR